MPIPPPPYELWEAVAFRARWPSADEDLMVTLGLGWTNAGESFRGAAREITDLPQAAWADEAGRMYREDQIPPLRRTTENVANGMLRLGGLARAYGDDVRYAKTEITRFIGQWDPLYADDPQTIGPAAAQAVVDFLDLIADRIAARGEGAGQEPLPVLPSPEEAAASHDFEQLVPPMGNVGRGPKPGEPNNGWGRLVEVKKADPAADKLAERIGGESRRRFEHGPDNEFDVVSDLYVAQTKPANLTHGKEFRDQAKATFEAALATGRTPYFHFEGPPKKGVLEALARYERRYGVRPVIDLNPLG
jgi:hypothetical protein